MYMCIKKWSKKVYTKKVIVLGTFVHSTES